MRTCQTLSVSFLCCQIQLYFESPLAMAETLLIDLFKQLSSIAVQLAKQEINLLVGVDEVQKLQGKLGIRDGHTHWVMDIQPYPIQLFWVIPNS